MSIYFPEGRRDRSEAAWARYQYHRRRAARAPLNGRRPGVLGPTLAGIADHERLLAIYRDVRTSGGPAPGVDGIHYTDVSVTEIAAALRQVTIAITERRYRPYPTRQVSIAKPSGGTRTLRIGTICDRIVATAVNLVVEPLVEQVLLPTCFGFRTGLSVLNLLADLERDIRDHDHFIVVTDDIRDAFGSVPINDVLADYRQIIQDEGLMELIETILRGADGHQRTVGIDQGSPLSPTTLNIRLHTCLDRPFAETQTSPLLRYVDNLVVATSSVPAGHQAIQRAVDLLRTAGFNLKGTEGPPTDIRHQCKHILGYRIRWINGRLRLAAPDQARQRLYQCLDEAYEEEDPISTATQAVRGWLGYYGPTCGGVDDVRSLARRAMAIAAERGIREVGALAEMEACIEGSRERWERMRHRTPLVVEGSPAPTRSAHGPPCPD